MQSNYITASIMILIIVTSSALAGEEVVMTITAHNPSRDKAQEIEVREILTTTPLAIRRPPNGA